MWTRILARNLILYLVLGLALAKTVDWDRCFAERGRYLLGIYYNGHFQNANDGLVYTDFLKWHNVTHDEFQKTLFRQVQ